MIELHQPSRYVLHDAANLSNGTMATLTRPHAETVTCADVEAIQHTWLAWLWCELDAGRTFPHWQAAWWTWLEECGHAPEVPPIAPEPEPEPTPVDLTGEPEREYELLLSGGGRATWTGRSGEEAARRYVDVHRSAAVIATRSARRHGLHIGLRPIID